MSGKCWNCSPSLFSPALLITAHALAQIDSEHSQSCHFVRPVTQLSLWWARKESLFFRQNLCVNAKSERIGTMFICRTLQKPASVLSALCSVYKLLRLSLPSTQQALWLWRSLRRNVMLNSTLQTSGFWVEGAYHWFHSFYTAHMPGERGTERERGRGSMQVQQSVPPLAPTCLAVMGAKCWKAWKLHLWLPAVRRVRAMGSWTPNNSCSPPITFQLPAHSHRLGSASARDFFPRVVCIDEFAFLHTIQGGFH